APTVRAPTTTASLILPPTGDVVLQAAEKALQPLIGFQDTAGGVFLEGTGVAPTLRPPTTTASLILPPADDVVLQAAEKALQPMIAADAQQAAKGGQNPAAAAKTRKGKGKGKAGAGANATPAATPAA
ncbi:MAG TPA: hypothetical protein VFQ80_15390, partial [Thermomicrobiales bacterium]|nr:hypothetical protein [Thermomicrobiales bacterium]